jgi:20S proteasome alpha/beta subunit
MSVVRGVSSLYGSAWGRYRNGLGADQMTLIFALLREDHIIFASDRRHITGDRDEHYVNDRGWKTEIVADGTAMLGFSGQDFVEQIIAPLKRHGELEAESVQQVAEAIAKASREKVEKYVRDYSVPYETATPPDIHFLLAGFKKDAGKSLATLYRIGPGNAYPLETCYDAGEGRRMHELIGMSNHGALYTLNKCAAHAMTVESGIQLAYFTLKEVTKYEFKVGGDPQICVIRRNAKVEDMSDKLEAHASWASEVGERIRALIVSPMHGLPER